MYIDESIFNEQMRGLMVARGGYTSEKKKEEIKRYWYLEFRSSDERAFIQVVGQLKFAGKSGDGFPSFRDFRELYNVVMPQTERLKGRVFCGLCAEGTVIFRGLNKAGEVHDMAAGCSRCSPNRDTQINPHNLFKDRLGYLRTADALAKDRANGDLRPDNDPDMEMEFVRPRETVQVPY